MTDLPWLNLTAWSAAGVMMAPTAIVCSELLASLFTRTPQFLPQPTRPDLAVLIPAHNECAMIGQTLSALQKQLRPGDRVLVVADNCTDPTARLARDAGAEVIERFDTSRRGKGYALEFGVRHLEHNPPAVVVVVDADVTLRPGSLDALVETTLRTGRPAQSVYVLKAPEGASLKDQISQLAFTIRNHVRAMGLMRLCGVCPLFGAGMAFPWKTIAAAPLGNGSIVEDLTLCLDLASAGSAPVLCLAARVDGTLVASHGDGDDLTQRRRWEHGHLRTIAQHASGLMLRSLLRGSFRAAVLATDVMVLPLSLLVIFTLLTAALLTVAGSLGAGFAPALTLLGGQVALGLLIALTWSRFSEIDRPLRPLLAVPAYMLRKIPLYIGFLAGAERVWHRAARPAPRAMLPADAPKRAA